MECRFYTFIGRSGDCYWRGSEFRFCTRLNYIYRSGDDLFVVYNEGRDYSDPTSTFRNRTLLVKFTHSFDF